jgi:uncharacterized protein YigE (DUF2233 family)
MEENMPIVAVAMHLALSQGLCPGVRYERWRTQAATVHVISVAAPATGRVRPVVAPQGRASLLALAGQGVAAINGGYFDPRTSAPVSWVLADGRTLSDPRQNRSLMTNPALQPYLPVIDKRTEWQSLQGPTGWRWQFASHGAPAPGGWALQHALQAGPQLLPDDGLVKEAFLRPGQDPLNAHGHAARSGLGLTVQGDLVLAMCPGGQSLATFRQTLQGLGCVSAMALDGGSSSQMAWRDGKGWHVVGPGGPNGRRAAILSALVVGGS